MLPSGTKPAFGYYTIPYIIFLCIYFILTGHKTYLCPVEWGIIYKWVINKNMYIYARVYNT